MAGQLESRPHVCFEVEKILGLSSDGSCQVQWAPSWVSKFHLVGCEHLIQEFLQQQIQQQQQQPQQQQPKQQQLEQQQQQQRQQADKESEYPMQADSAPVADDSLFNTYRESPIKTIPQSAGVQEAIQLPHNHLNILADEVHVKAEENDREITEDSIVSLHDVKASCQINTHSISNTVFMDTYSTSVTYTDNYADKSTDNSESCESPSNLFVYQSTDASMCDVTSTLNGSELSKTVGPFDHSPSVLKPPNYHCPVCEKDCWSHSNLAIHMRTHTGQKPFQCSHCDRSFASNKTLKKHERTHSGEKPYQCLYCGMSFSRNDVMKEHLRIHTEDKRHTCIYCGKGFIKKADIEKHVCVHSGERPYTCGVCGKTFTLKNTMRSHFLSHNCES